MMSRRNNRVDNFQACNLRRNGNGEDEDDDDDGDGGDDDDGL